MSDIRRIHCELYFLYITVNGYLYQGYFMDGVHLSFLFTK